MIGATLSNNPTVEAMVWEYQHIGMNDSDIISAMASDGFSSEIVNAALNKGRITQIPPMTINLSRISPERLSDICARIQGLCALQLQKTVIRGRLLTKEGGVTDEEFEAAWVTKFGFKAKWEGKFILAAGGVNQYNSGSPAGCSLLACRFVANTREVTPEDLRNLIQTTVYEGNKFLNTEVCISQFKELSLIENPWEEQRYLSNTMQVSFDRRDVCSLQKATVKILSYEPLQAAIITGNGLTVGLRKVGEYVEIFDSHGDATITNAGNTAYVMRFRLSEVSQVTEFLEMKFPDIGFAGSGLGGIEIWPLGRKV